MRKFIAGLVVIAALGVAACGESNDSTEPTTATVTTTSTEPTDVAPVADVEPTQAEIDEKIAAEYVKYAPKAVMGVCKGTAVLGEARSEAMFTRILGPQVLKQDGTISGVFDAVMDKC